MTVRFIGSEPPCLAPRPRRLRPIGRPGALAGGVVEVGAAAAYVHAALNVERRDSGEQDAGQVDRELKDRAAEFRPFGVGGGDADVGRGGDRRDGDEHADQGAGFCRGQRQHAGAAGDQRDDEREGVGIGDEVGERVGIDDEVVGSEPDGVDEQRQHQRRGDADRKADRERAEGALGDVGTALDEGDAETGDRSELGAEDHRAHDQDRRVEEDSDRGDHAGERHERAGRAR